MWPFSKGEPEATTNGKAGVSVYTSPSGLVRVTYRNEMTGEDDFNRGFMESDLSADGKTATVRSETFARFCLQTFCTTIECKVGNKWESKPFTWDVLRELRGPYVGDGWPVKLALEIFTNVLQKKAVQVEAVKKTSEIASEPSNLESPQPGTQPAASPTST